MYEYYDEAYFERGSEKGTAYVGYLEGAPRNIAYLEIAQAIKAIFKPRKCLEIGCATGVIVRHLNQLGVEAHGVDPSEWAVKNRSHDNVILGSAEKLPFETHAFDLVYSCHALEHIPQALKENALAEMRRVSSGMHWHLLPVLGEGPYVGDRNAAIEGLKKDPTHSLLLDRSEWFDAFAAHGWVPLNPLIAIENDTSNFELSHCQIAFHRTDCPSDEVEAVLARIADWNFRRFCTANQQVQKQRSLVALTSAEMSSLRSPTRHHLGLTDGWMDLVIDAPLPLDLSRGALKLSITADGTEIANVRIALISDSIGSDEQDPKAPAVLEAWLSIDPGLNIRNLRPHDFRTLRGLPDLSKIKSVLLGGTGEATDLTATLSVTNADNQRATYAFRLPDSSTKSDGDSSQLASVGVASRPTDPDLLVMTENVDRLKAEMRRLRLERNKYLQEITLTRASTSWRITQPLRALRRLI